MQTIIINKWYKCSNSVLPLFDLVIFQTMYKVYILVDMVTETVLLPQKPQWSIWSRNKQFHICIQTCSFSHCSWPYPAADHPPSACRFLSDGGSATHLAFHSGALYSQPPGLLWWDMPVCLSPLRADPRTCLLSEPHPNPGRDMAFLACCHTHISVTLTRQHLVFPSWTLLVSSCYPSFWAEGWVSHTISLSPHVWIFRNNVMETWEWQLASLLNISWGLKTDWHKAQGERLGIFSACSLRRSMCF